MNGQGQIDLDESEYNRILQARNNLLLLISIEENYDLLMSNYLDFENNLLAQATIRLITKSPSFRDDLRLVNKLLMNLLMSGKMYSDQNKHYVSDMFGRSSQIYKDFDQELESKNKQILGYRFMEALRDYSQHRGWLIHGISYPGGWVGEEPNKRLTFTFIPRLSIKYLQNDGRSTLKDILKEMGDLEEDIDIRLYVREYIQGLIEVHSKLRNLLQPYKVNWKNMIRITIKKYQDQFPGEEHVDSLSLFCKNGDGSFDSVGIFMRLIDDLEHLEEVNLNIANLPLSYVTNEIEIRNK